MTDDDTRVIPETAFCLRSSYDVEAFFDADDAPPQPAPARRAARRPRKVTLAAALKEAAEAGQHVAGAVVDQDGRVELKFGAAAVATPSDTRDVPRYVL